MVEKPLFLGFSFSVSSRRSSKWVVGEASSTHAPPNDLVLDPCRVLVVDQ